MRKVIGLAVLVVALAGTAAAQGGDSHPGSYPIEDMGLLKASELEVNIDLAGPVLEVAAGALREEGEDADLSQLVSQLERVRVQVGPAESSQLERVAASFDEAIHAMESAGWKRFLAVADGEDRVYLFALQRGELITGLTALVHEDGDEIVLANVAGAIDPTVLGRVLAKIGDLPNLSRFVDGSR